MSMYLRSLCVGCLVALLMGDGYAQEYTDEFDDGSYEYDAEYDASEFGGMQRELVEVTDYPELKNGYYMTLFAGGTIAHSNYDPIEIGGSTHTFHYGDQYGGYGGVSVGLREDWLIYGIRPELEFSISSYEINDARISPAPSNSDVNYNFESRVYRGMINILYDLEFDKEYFGYMDALYVGAGMGMAFYDFVSNSDETGTNNHMDPEVAFGYQFLTGVRFVINERVGFNVGYRYFSTQDVKMTYTPVGASDSSRLRDFTFRTHGVEVGVYYGF